MEHKDPNEIIFNMNQQNSMIQMKPCLDDYMDGELTMCRPLDHCWKGADARDSGVPLLCINYDDIQINQQP